MYLLLAISLKKVGDIAGALKILELAVQRFKNYYDAYIYRGKLYLK